MLVEKPDETHYCQDMFGQNCHTVVRVSPLISSPNIDPDVGANCDVKALPFE